MRQHDVPVGTIISAAFTELVKEANLHNESVKAEFNGIEVVAQPGDDAGKLYMDYQADQSRRAREYHRSREGKRARRQQDKRKRQMQRQAEKVMRDLRGLDFSNFEELIDFLDRLADSSDHVDVTFDSQLVVDEFVKHGFTANANVGDEYDDNDSENSARWLIGQALDGLESIGAIHPIYHKFADEWREKFALVATC